MKNQIPEADVLNQRIFSLSEDPRWASLIERARPYQDKRDDAGHSAAVTCWAAELLRYTEEEADKTIVLTAALLHDVGWSTLSDKERCVLFSEPPGSVIEKDIRLKHEREGVRLARRILRESGYGEAEIAELCRIIDGHDSREADLSVNDSILRDADTLWMVTNTGFQADLRRRNLKAEEWAQWLERRFSTGRPFYTSRAKTIAYQRLSLLKSGQAVPLPGEDRPQKVLICHYRVGWTDGVSLEIEKRQNILKEMGFECELLAGPGSKGADFMIDDLDFDTPDARMISRNAFGGLKEYKNEQDLLKDIHTLAGRIEKQINMILEKSRPDFILLHNIFSHGRHIAAAEAFCNALQKYGVPSLATHHDFYWERDDFRTPSGPVVEGFLSRFVPPLIPGMRHAVINSLAARNLLNKTGIDAMIFPDTLDFSVDQWEKDDYNAHILSDFQLKDNDIFILQATRIVRRKGIELIPPLIAMLNRPEYLDQLQGKTLYNGKKITQASRFVFLLAGYAEQEALPYIRELEELMQKEKVPYRFLRSRIAVERKADKEGLVYSLFDTYPYADIVSYPSIYEGWGNQFIEAVFARKPVIVHEYPVFRSDILPKGYDVISLGSSAEPGERGLYRLPEQILRKACQEVVDWLLSGQTEEKLARNFTLAESNNSYDYLRALMRQSMEHYDGI